MNLKQIFFALLSVLSTLLAACSGGPPQPFDWCYKFDFRATNDGITMHNGAWLVGIGFLTDNNNLLALEYTHSQTVYPKEIRIRIERNASSGDISIAAAGQVFGIDITRNETLPSFVNDFEGNIPAPASNSNSQTAQIAIQSSGQIAMSWVEIYGVGPSPFGLSNCGGFEDTPTPNPLTPGPPTNTPWPTSMPTETDLPSDTPEPTETDVPTETPTPSTTTTPIFCSDFNVDWSGSNYEIWFGTLSGGVLVGTLAQPNNNKASGVVVDLPPDAIVNRVQFDYQMSSNGAARLYNPQNGTLIAEITPGGAGSSWRTANFTGLSYTSAQNEIQVQVEGGFNSQAATIALDNIEIFFCIPNATATPSPTRTITMTRTPSPTRTPQPGGPTFTPYDDEGTCFVCGTRTPLSVNSPTAFISATMLPTLTAQSPIIATYTGTIFAPMPTFLPTGEPGEGGGDGDEDAGEITIANVILSVVNWFVNLWLRFWDLIGQIINWLVGTARNFVTIIGNVLATIAAIIAFILNIAREIIEIFGLLIQIGVRLLELLVSWIADGIARIGAMITAFYNAPSSPIPGLPLCATNPTAHDLCAIYAILDDTLLEQNTWGQFLVPIALINIDLWMLFYFAKFVLKLLRRGETITNVG